MKSCWKKTKKVYTIGRLSFIFLILSIICGTNFAFSAQVDLNFDNKTLNFKIVFNKEFKIVDSYKDGNSFYVKLKTDEKLDALNKEFWGYSVERIVTEKKENFKIITFDLISKNFKANLKRTGNVLFVSFNVEASPAGIDLPSTNLYLRTFIGLIVILVFIFIILWLIKLIYRSRNAFQLTGIGNILGRVDLLPGKSLIFYELGKIIYIFSSAGNNLRFVDKITDEVTINLIKEGFSRRKDFSSYLRFSKKKNVSDDVEDTKSILKERLDSLRKR
ncbi:MAG: hypothetical protein SVN78_06845 [Deferribacterota bacterium]|nr:hypothetical protein [Deferribacterota bacterium]